MADKTEEEDPRRAKHLVRVERRAKYLATLTPAQRRVRDDYIGWVRWWRKDYKALVDQIMRNKKFIRFQGHNNRQSLRMAMGLLERQRKQARSMLLARAAGKVDYIMRLEPRVRQIRASAQTNRRGR